MHEPDDELHDEQQNEAHDKQQAMSLSYSRPQTRLAGTQTAGLECGGLCTGPPRSAPASNRWLHAALSITRPGRATSSPGALSAPGCIALKSTA